jgi:hypothetical protein
MRAYNPDVAVRRLRYWACRVDEAILPTPDTVTIL